MNIKQVPAHPNNYDKSQKTKVGIVFHWIVGSLESAGSSFQNPNRRASAHYGIGDNEIHQFVDEKYTAWHCGNYPKNQIYIGIEHEGGQMVNGQRQKPSQMTHDTSAELCANICRRWGITKLEYGKNAFRHRDITPTECSGSLDVEYIINKTNQILNNNMSFKFKLEPKDGNVYLIATKGAYKGTAEVERFNAGDRNGTKFSVNIDRYNNDGWGSPVITEYDPIGYKVTAGGFMQSIDFLEPEQTPDPCGDVKFELQEERQKTIRAIEEKNDMLENYNNINNELNSAKSTIATLNTKVLQKEDRIRKIKEDYKDLKETIVRVAELERTDKAINENEEIAMSRFNTKNQELEKENQDLKSELENLKNNPPVIEKVIENDFPKVEVIEKKAKFLWGKFNVGLAKMGITPALLTQVVTILLSYFVSAMPQLEPYKEGIIALLTGTGSLGSLITIWLSGQREVMKQKNKSK